MCFPAETFDPIKGPAKRPVPAFWGYSVAARAPDAARALLEAARLPLVLDLDETLLAAFAGGQLEARLEAARIARRAARADAASATDPAAQCVPLNAGFTGLLAVARTPTPPQL